MPATYFSSSNIFIWCNTMDARGNFWFTFAVFNYAGGGHNMAEVSAADYASCSAANALSSDGSSATTIALKTAGKHYFICGVTGHYSNDMKPAVDIAATTAASPPKASPTPDTPDTPSTTPTSPSTPGATPKTPATVLAPPTKQSESGATGLRAIGDGHDRSLCHTTSTDRRWKRNRNRTATGHIGMPVVRALGATMNCMGRH